MTRMSGVVKLTVGKGAEGRQLPSGAAGEGHKTASPKIFYD